ncbi:nucleoside triphosphate pyrophosphohydrolase [Microbacterium sp. K24]|uniref:nucleoside triphosphate pyrophosphohydrolase n=1 Tax=Microbacterium sp. K24 TaxID=2305446 RepID=UPI00109C5AAD|nr:nucleoside triphosphate pyrophosphohydrolase [Microbacterium sp. K24]
MTDQANSSDILAATPSLQPIGVPLAEPRSAGGKASGLLQLSPQWYPETIIVLPAAHASQKAGKIAKGFLIDLPGAAVVLNRVASTSPSGRVYVRSNARTENLYERGRFESVSIDNDVTDLETTIERLWGEVVEAHIDLGFLLQPLIEVRASGHLSNEHRVSREANLWISEYDGWTGATAAGRWRVDGADPAPNGPLLCSNGKQVESILRSVAKRLSKHQVRYHLEWIWDGARVWIVQSDAVEPQVGPAPGDAWTPTIGDDVPAGALTVWSLCTPPSEGGPPLSSWPKASALDEFARSGLPVADLWRLEGRSVMQALADGDDIAGMEEDLSRICSGHVVVRTDIRGGQDLVMLPKTGTTISASEVFDWLRSTTAGLMRDGHRPQDISFLAHRFLASRAAAWVHARPDDPMVTVASIWGLADGLAWLPHDRGWVNVDTDDVRRSVSAKTSFLDVDANRGWTYRDSPTEWIWRASMSKDELRTVAQGSRQLADELGESVLVMWFIGVRGRASYYLPWFHMPAPVDLDDVPPTVSPQSTRIDIRSIEDLQRIVASELSGSPVVLRVRPLPEFVRDNRFVDVLAEKANDINATVELVGSSLAHPYYVLRRAGVTVSCIDTLEEKSIQFNKLVRDGIVEKILAGGESATAYTATGADLAQRLRRKAVEEAIELLQAQSAKDTVEEMADLLEVLDGLRSSLGVSPEEILDVQNKKREQRGGFREGAVLLRTGAPADAKGAKTSTLFDEDPSWRSTWQVKNDGDKIRLQCVPPLFGERHSFHAVSNGVNVFVEYRGTAIELSVMPLPASDGVASTLFDD